MLTLASQRLYLAREKEQEWRRKEAMADTIDMTPQSDFITIMTKFENNFD